MSHSDESGYHEMIGTSLGMRQVRSQIALAAGKPINVLIDGETGTGKELVALALHQCSTRRTSRFVAVNCGAIPETLVEAEFFGYERGAFTGAVSRRAGYFEQASAGTLLLDEVGDLPFQAQTKLLRVLQNKRVQRLGASDAVSVDIRVVSATHRNLNCAVQDGHFRQDLFFRLNGYSIHIPPLRERAEDIPDLVWSLIHRSAPEFGCDVSAVQTEAIQFLQNQLWPGNIRQLENVIRHAMLHSQTESITRDRVYAAYAHSLGGAPAAPVEPSLTVAGMLAKAQQGLLDNAYERVMELVERELITQAAQLAHGNQSRMSRLLGVDRKTVLHKLRRFGLNPHQERDARP